MIIRNPKALIDGGAAAYCIEAEAIVTMHTDTCDWCGHKHPILSGKDTP